MLIITWTHNCGVVGGVSGELCAFRFAERLPENIFSLRCNWDRATRAKPEHRCLFAYSGACQIPYVGMAQQYTESAYLLAVGCKHTELENRALTAQVLSLKLPVQHP